MSETHRLLRALRRQPVDRTPVWLMRQAGRYLPEYRAVRARAGSFLAMARDPETACEITLQPLRRYPLDAAILFSDILVVPDALGLGLHFVEGEGPRFQRPIAGSAEIRALHATGIEERLAYVAEAVRLIRHELAGQVPLIGFAGSPLTLACYMVEGGASPDFARARALAFAEPEGFAQLIDRLVDATVRYLAMQRAAGADALMIFDTWGTLFPANLYRRFALPSLAAIAKGLRRIDPQVPLILFGRGTGLWLEDLAALGYDALGLDWTVDLAEARSRVGGRVALQGNLDPAVLLASPEAIEAETARVLSAYAGAPGHVFNLGHGLAPTIDPDRVALLVDSVARLSAPLHGAV